MPRRLRSLRLAYVAVFALGVSLLLIGAFHPNIWYDESYSVALARWDWADIWRLDALDVHPPLYYLLLHAVHLCFGDSVLVYRLFSAVGMVATAALGPVLVRRLWGDAEGLVFSALILLLPNFQHMAWQIRMYSWTVFAATLCFLLAVRIARAAREGERTTFRAWIMFAGASLACAYLHYYGTITAFLVNAGLLVQLLRARRGLRAFAVQAMAQVALFLPWLLTLASQVYHVSSGYWITFTFPDSLLDIIFLPFKTDQLWQDDDIRAALLVVLVVASGLLLVHRFRHCDAWREAALHADEAGHPFDRATVVFGIAIYLGTIAIVGAASLAMGRIVLMYRYLVIPLGPLCVAAALGLSRLGRLVAYDGGSLRPVRLGLRVTGVGFLIACIGIWGAVVAALFDPMTAASVAAVHAVRDNGATILTDSGRVGGILAALEPHERIVYLDFTKDAWWEPGVRCAYGDAVHSVDSWGEAFDQMGDRALFISDRDTPNAVEELTRELGAAGLHVERAERILRPYDRVTWTLLTCTRS